MCTEPRWMRVYLLESECEVIQVGDSGLHDQRMKEDPGY